MRSARALGYMAWLCLQPDAWGGSAQFDARHPSVVFGKDLIHAPFTVPDALFRFVVGARYLLREWRDFAQLCDAIDGSFATE